MLATGAAPRLALVAAVLAVAACALVPPRIDPPEVALADVRIERLGADDIQARLVLDVTNPNDSDVALEALAFTLALAGEQVVEASMPGRQTLPRARSRTNRRGRPGKLRCLAPRDQCRRPPRYGRLRDRRDRDH